MIKEIVADAHRAGLSVRLRVLKVNSARGLYERLSFSVSDEAPTAYVMRALPSPIC